MADLAPLAVAVPMIAAAALVAVSAVVPRRVVDALALGVAVACVVLCALVLDDASDGTIVHWFGGWEPRDGVALGISVDDGGLSLDVFSPVGLLPVAAVAGAVQHRTVVRTETSPAYVDDYK